MKEKPEVKRDYYEQSSTLCMSGRRWDVEKNNREIRVVPAAMNIWVYVIVFLGVVLFGLCMSLLIKAVWPLIFLVLTNPLGVALFYYIDSSGRRKGPCFICDVDLGSVELPRNNLSLPLADVTGFNVVAELGKDSSTNSLEMQYVCQGVSYEALMLQTPADKYICDIGKEVADFTGKEFFIK